MFLLDKKVLFFSFFMISFSVCNTKVLDCLFNFSFKKAYTCVINDGYIFGDFHVNITNVAGHHYEYNTNIDVQAIQTKHNKYKLYYIPRNIEKFFKNIIAMDLNWCNIQAISEEDFKPFQYLQTISLFNNHISEILEDTFVYNKKLETIDLGNNDIYYIGPTTFSHLKKLKKLYLNMNVCISIDGKIEQEVLKIIKEIEEGKCVDEKIREINATILSTTIETQADPNINNHIKLYLWIVLVSLIIIVLFIIILAVKVIRKFKRIEEIERKVEELKRKSILEMREDLGHLYDEIQNQTSLTNNSF
ncbi:hypothetical protein PVAND_006351 [Polypedilum vanderplanki]|uniref:Leucine-rich repeat protein n=1 Tax=Polypedilum vanderplanki TaxID=319348 RepID=A0A9J6C3D3_POLVA|nr:hypothetical protein PVAND_006351 [Polypedilum vanderplanki]